ncbi:unnamed protein product [Prorocentrum cordatum]|nr:unnamed protein product [Polarella glacialis]
MLCRVLALVGSALPLLARGDEKLVGEDGQPVLSCQCKGKKATHGYCGYHLNAFSDSDLPWCRTKHGCGQQSIRGAWTHCSPHAVERRLANDGKLYHVKEFRDFYKKEGKQKWADAAPFVERRMASNRVAYTVHEFRSYYIDGLGEEGWVDKWINADPEQRRAKDGKWYTWNDFVKHYDLKEAFDKWDASAIWLDGEL